MSRLKARVLADPLDADARQQLQAARAEQDRRFRLGLDGLVAALLGRLVEDPVARQAGWIKADRSPSAIEWAKRYLGGDTLAAIRQGEPTATAPSDCRRCGGTGLEDCRRCRGLGVLPCERCQGRGEPAPGRLSRGRPDAVCPVCRGSGAAVCPICTGHGVLPCRHGGSSPGKKADKQPAQRADARPAQLLDFIFLARYLRDGGIDLYTPNALTKSPRINETEVND